MNAIDLRVRLPKEYRTVSPEEQAEFYGKYNELLNVIKNSEKTADDLLKEMDAAKVDFAVIHAEYEFGENADELNKAVASLVTEHPQKFAGFGTVNLKKPQPLDLVRQAEEIHTLGLKGINLQPVFFEISPLDRRLYPLYATAHKLGLILSFHTGIHYSLNHAIKENSPLFIDQLSVDFPGLKIIACHGGWPWTQEMMAIARRHSNVFLEFGGVAPKYIAQQGTGWEPIYSALPNLLEDQILFGTDWPVLSMKRAKDEWELMGLKEATLNKLFYENALKLLNIEMR